MSEEVRDRTNILLIGDDPGNARLIQEMIAETDGGAYHLSCVESLQPGLERLEKGKFDVVLVDLHLTDKSGVDALRKLCSRVRELPVIAVSSLDDISVAARTVKEGSQDYLVKGKFDSRLLIRSIRCAMERKHNEQIKSNFINNASHELRTHLSILKLALSNLEKCLGNGKKEQQQKMLHMAEVNVERLVKFINNLLDFGRLELGKATINRSPVSVQDILMEAVENFETEARDQNIILDCDIGYDLPEVYASESMIMRVMNNLLSNAMHYAREKITITASIVEVKDIHPADLMPAVPDSRTVRISVIDDGEGIPEDKIKYLFSKFYRAQNQKEENLYRGTGLGLTICKEIMDQHDGRIWVESKIGQGARFNILLPVNSTHHLSPRQSL